MSKLNSLVVFGMVVFAGQVAFGQGTPVSYHVTGVSGGWHTVVDPVPAGGFILTDIVSAGVADRTLTVAEGSSGSEVTRFITTKTGRAGNNLDGIQVHLQTGIRFSAGDRVATSTAAPTADSFTFIGYIPSSGSVPAVGAWGLLVMLLMIVVGGTMVLRQRRVAA